MLLRNAYSSKMTLPPAYLDVLFEPIALPGGKIIDVGASLGKAVYPRDGSDLSALLAVADRAMYQSKANRLAQYY